MAARSDWTLADATVEWRSTRAAPEASPRGWHHEQMDGSVALKCTTRGVYHNQLVQPNTFHYELPQRRGDAGGVLERLVHEGRCEEKRIEVRLFLVQHAADHYLGEWAVYATHATPVKTSLVLKRLACQSEVVLDAYRIKPRRARSLSEARHLSEIRAWLPGWNVAHEPETAVGLDAPLVVDGRLQEFAGDAYTHDYVVASPRGCKRLCIESKASDEGLTEEAKQKCRALRDVSLCRVVAMIDHGAALHWHDFGPPGSSEERSFRNDEVEALNRALGVSAATPACAAAAVREPTPSPCRASSPAGARMSWRASEEA